MSRTLLGCGLALWVGLTLVLADLRWFARRPLSERLQPYVAGAATGSQGVLSAGSFAELVGPLAAAVGARASRLLGVVEPVERRLERIHAPVDSTEFRVRQSAWSLGALLGGAALALALGAPVPLSAVLVVVPPVLAFVVLEQQLGRRSAAWQRRLTLELPVVTEQLATLLSAGWSLGGAIGRVADRGHGACAADLAKVRTRIQQGLSSNHALTEWSALARVDALDRVVAVLNLDREASDLGRLLSDEARAIRRQVHRELLESIERRTQQVWIPVTVATLVPGVIFLAVPFVEALSLYAGS